MIEGILEVQGPLLCGKESSKKPRDAEIRGGNCYVSHLLQFL